MLKSIKAFIGPMRLNILDNCARLMSKIPGSLQTNRIKCDRNAETANPYIKYPQLFTINPELFKNYSYHIEALNLRKQFYSSAAQGRIQSLCHIDLNNVQAFGGASEGENRHLWMQSFEFDEYIDFNLGHHKLYTVL